MLIFCAYIVNQKVIIGIGVGVAVIAAISTAAIMLTSGSPAISPAQTIGSSVNTTSQSSGSAAPIQVVAAENFWGSLVSQLGGSRVQVLSIISDPNADPHEYASSTVDARAFATAGFVIINGAGYDSWASKLISAANNPNQKVLNVADMLGKKEGDNPHFWYSPSYVNRTVNQIYVNLVSIDPSNKAYYTEQYSKLNQSLGVYDSRISAIKEQFGGAKVAATENIFAYLANASGLDLASPPEFMQAVSEGNDPPANTVAQFQDLLQNGNVTMLVYNDQTVTPLTQNIKSLAAQKGIPTVGVTETIQPANLSFQDWMNAELISMQKALNAHALGK